MTNEFKIYCEGDIERFAVTMAALIETGKAHEVEVKCPTGDWPFFVMDQVADIFENMGMADQLEPTVNIIFKPDVMNDDESELSDLAARIDDMDDDELSDFLDQMLGDFEARSDEDDEDDDDDDDSGDNQ